eukprot:m51a1_g4887 hypothetical protein (330) ;mRNA; f:71033-72520
MLISHWYTYKPGPKGRPDNDKKKKPDHQCKKEPRRNERSKPKQATMTTLTAAASTMTYGPLAKSKFGKFEIMENGTILLCQIIKIPIPKIVKDELTADLINIPMPNIIRTFEKGKMPLIKLGPLITENPQWCTKFTELFTEFSDICEPLDDQPAKLPQKFHIDILEGANMPYKSDCILSDTKKVFIKSELNKYEVIGIYIKDSMIRKKKATLISLAESNPGVFQMCEDYRKKNTIMVKIKYPMQYTHDMIMFCSGRWYWAKFDWKRSFWQGENDEKTFRFLVLNTPFGIYHPTRVTFGSCNVAPFFQNKIEYILEKEGLRPQQMAPYAP